MAAAVAIDEVKLLSLWPSPFVMRARIALNLKGVSYELFEESRVSKSELLIKSNPVYKKVPILIHAGHAISESMIIVQYIDDVWSAAGPPILPSDPYDRAVARFWAAYIDDKLFPSFMGIIKGNNQEAKDEAAEQMVAVLQPLQQAFERCCGKGEGNFFGGETVGYVDIALGSWLGWIKAAEKIAGGVKILDEAKLPLLVGWAERFCSADAVREVMPDADKLVEVSKVLPSMRNATPAD